MQIVTTPALRLSSTYASRTARVAGPTFSNTLQAITRRLHPPAHQSEKPTAEAVAELASLREALLNSVAQRTRLEAAVESAATEERNRIAREIHDTIAQALTAVVLQLQTADAALSDGGVGEAREHLQHAMKMARGGLSETRACLRGLRESAGEEAEVCTAAAELVKRMSAHTRLSAAFVAAGEPKKVPADWAASLLRIIQESLTNALRHGDAKRFDAELAFDPGALRLTLRDDGRGFDPAQAKEGFGLLGIKERVAAMRGEVTIASAAGKGTTTLVVLPFR